MFCARVFNNCQLFVINTTVSELIMSSKASLNRKLRRTLEGLIVNRPGVVVFDEIRNSPPPPEISVPESCISDLSDVKSEDTLSASEDCSEEEDQAVNSSYMTGKKEHVGVSLLQWIYKTGTSRRDTDALLSILHDKFNCPVPKTQRSLLGLKKKDHPIRNVSNGNVLHLGIQSGLRS